MKYNDSEVSAGRAPTAERPCIHGYVAKQVADKVINKGGDIIAKIVERKLSQSDSAGKKTVTIYGPDNKELYRLGTEPMKTKRKR